MTMHSFDCRVYYEDTDMGGVVYYANYLKFIERARSAWVRELGIDQRRLREAGIVFAVRRIEADFFAPAHFDDLLQVATSPVEGSGARAVLDQVVLRGDVRLFAARVTLVTLGPAGRSARLPEAVRAAFAGAGRG